jgi:hypothetical protein
MLRTLQSRSTVILFVALALYASSLELPGLVMRDDRLILTTVTYGPNGHPIYAVMGRDILLTGWLGPTFSWYANPIAFFTLVFLIIRFKKTALVFSILAVIISLTAFRITNYDFTTSTAHSCYVDTLTPATNPACSTVDHLGIGYFVWLFSLLLLVLYCAMHLQLGRSQIPTISPIATRDVN